MLDAAVPMIALAIGIGRIGDILLTDHLGTPTTSPFALAYLVRPGYDLAPGFGPSPARVPGRGESCSEVGAYFAGCAYHLPPVYDMLGALALAAVLLMLQRRARYCSGTATGLFGVWYGTQRLLLDFTRGIDEQPLLGLTTTQLLAIVLILVSASVLAVIGIRGHGLGDEPADPPSARHRSSPAGTPTRWAATRGSSPRSLTRRWTPPPGSPRGDHSAGPGSEAARGRVSARRPERGFADHRGHPRRVPGAASHFAGPRLARSALAAAAAGAAGTEFMAGWSTLDILTVT